MWVRVILNLVGSVSTCVGYRMFHIHLHVSVFTWSRINMSACIVHVKGKYCLKKPSQLYTHAYICTHICVHAYTYFAEVFSGTVRKDWKPLSNACFRNSSRGSWSPGGCSLWIPFVTPLCCLRVNTAEAEDGADQRVFPCGGQRAVPRLPAETDAWNSS